jgi:predicted DNA-binding protein
MQDKRKNVGRPVTKPNRKKIGLSISSEAHKTMEALAEATKRTKSNIVEEALQIMKENSDTITARIKKIEEMGDDVFMDFEAYAKERNQNDKVLKTA